MNSQQTTRLYIDNPWEEVEAQIREIAAEEITVACDCITPAEVEFAEDTAKRIATSVMQRLDGGDYPADKHGLRESA